MARTEKNDAHLQDDPPSAKDQAALWERAQKVRFAMITTRTEDGAFASRPMTLQDVDDDGTLWFFAAADTKLGDDVRRDSTISVTFAKPDDDFYLAVAGEGHFIDDREKVEALWNIMTAAWFDGPDDPNLWLLRVQAERVDYWKPGVGRTLQMVAMLKAAITNTRPGKSVGEHGSFEPRTAQ